jgi:hypothetical protein
VLPGTTERVCSGGGGFYGGGPGERPTAPLCSHLTNVVNILSVFDIGSVL